MKRFLDLILSIFGLLILSPLLIIVSLIIKYSDGASVFFRGERVGRHGHPFQIFKFRTMFVNADQIGGSSTSENDSRITPVGHFLRKYKIDELPQLINVLKGDMSFVGPRPQVPWAVKLYNEEEKKLLSVRPGITDYASIKFRNEGNILKNSANPDEDYLKKIAPEKIRLGLEYVNNNNLWIDMKIIIVTIGVLFYKES